MTDKTTLTPKDHQSALPHRKQFVLPKGPTYKIPEFISPKEKRRRKARITQQGRRLKAIHKVANGRIPTCAVCKCPHIHALTFGHYKGDGKKHRKFIRKNGFSDILPWILKIPTSIVLERIRLECYYCNYFHGHHNRYPHKHELPTWPNKDE